MLDEYMRGTNPTNWDRYHIFGTFFYKKLEDTDAYVFSRYRNVSESVTHNCYRANDKEQERAWTKALRWTMKVPDLLNKTWLLFPCSGK
jgi:hypothetical protein